MCRFEKMVGMKSESRPLVVDLDGTLIRNDLLHDSLLYLLIRRPLLTVQVFNNLLKGKLALKRFLATVYVPANNHLVTNSEVISLIRKAKGSNRLVVLVSASHQSLVSSVADGLGLFDEAIGSNSKNLSGSNKSDYLVAKFGHKGFDYVGNSKADLPVWESAKVAYVVTKSTFLLREASKVNVDVQVVATQDQKHPLLKSMRIHQWIKNLLIFVPLLTSYQFYDLQLTSKSVVAFFSFGFLASGIYLINDLSDVNSDREHHKKRLRPIAAGLVSVPVATLAAFVLVTAGLLAAVFVNQSFLVLAIGYLLLTSSYSFMLKQIAVLDCVILASLYTIRVIAGGIATGIPITNWLLAFSSFIFFSLAWMKRYAELHNSTSKEKVSGRGYFKSDLTFIFGLGSASGLLSILVFALYIENIQSSGGYQHADFAWLALPVLTYWLCRVWLIAYRGEMNEDPIIFAAKDKVSIICGLLLFITLALAHTGALKGLIP
jgi:4-hydroxybenzoate polyprenyltransferase/phosphoserine phosphatase